MVISVIDDMGVTINELKKYSPIAGYFDRVKAPFIAN